jgi:hypothetical protein
LTGPEIIAAYGLRFKIEVTFRQLVHLLGSFAYRFWLNLHLAAEQKNDWRKGSRKWKKE